MSEALIVRKGGMNASSKSYIELTVMNSLGSTGAANANIIVTDDGVTLGTFTTNETGKVRINSNIGHVYGFKETGNGLPYIDVEYNEISGYICNNDVEYVRLIRKQKESVEINTNKNIMFSDGCKSVDIYASGGGGSSGFTSYYHTGIVYYNFGNMRHFSSSYPDWYTEPYGTWWSTMNEMRFNNCWGGNGYTNNKIGFNPSANYNYKVVIGQYGGYYSSGTFFASGPQNQFISWNNGRTDNMTFVLNDALYAANYNNSINNRINSTPNIVSAGGTTYFSNIISANGGSAGNSAAWNKNGSNGRGGVGAAGGKGSGGSVFEGCTGINDVKNKTVLGWTYIASCMLPVRGNNGYVILNNFTYK